MPLPTVGNPISLGDLQSNFGGTNPAGLDEYYRGGTYVANIAGNSKVPTSGTISLGDFYGAVPKIIVVNNITRTNVDLASEFVIGGVNYWNSPIEKEYINNGTIGSNDAASPALTVSAGRVGAFTLTNNSNIYGAGGRGGLVGQGPALAQGQRGGTAIFNASSNYTIVNNGNIWGGGGGGARGRNGGTGGQGGPGQYVITPARTIVTTTTRQETREDQRCGRCNTQRDPGPATDTWTQISLFDRFFVGGGLLGTGRGNWGGPTPGNTLDWRRGGVICEVLLRGTRQGQTVDVGFLRSSCIIRVYRLTITTTTTTTIPAVLGTVGGCPGIAGGLGGQGGDGQGFQRQAGPTNGLSGQLASPGGYNCCADTARGGGCGGFGGNGGSGATGGSWGQTGGSQLNGTAGGNGLSGNLGGGQAGTAGGSNPSSPGAGGFYIQNANGNNVTFSATGSRLGQAS